MESKYLSKIETLTKEGLFSMNGNRLLIELMEEGEKVTKGGIITNVAPQKNFAALDKAKVAVVLAAGPGYEVEETGEQVDLKYKPGDYILLNQFAVKTFGEFFGLADYKADTIGLITEDLVHGKITNFETFNSILKG